MVHGSTPPTNGVVQNRPGQDDPVELEIPVAVTKGNIESTVIKDGFLKPSDICTGTYASLCTEIWSEIEQTHDRWWGAPAPHRSRSPLHHGGSEEQ